MATFKFELARGRSHGSGGGADTGNIVDQRDIGQRPCAGGASAHSWSLRGQLQNRQGADTNKVSGIVLDDQRAAAWGTLATGRAAASLAAQASHGHHRRTSKRLRLNRLPQLLLGTRYQVAGCVTAPVT